jgi:hypothetical protein
MARQHIEQQRDRRAPRQFTPHQRISLPDHPRISRPSSRAPRPLTPPRSPLAVFRIVSPALMPLVMASTCLALLLVLALVPSGTSHLRVSPESLGPIFFLFAALGVVLAAAMAYAPGDALWALALATGFLAYVTITVWAIFGPPAAVLLVIGLAVLLVVVVRAQAHTVLEDSVHVMVLLGKYHRTLGPGFHLRLPGEQVWAILHTSEVTLDVAVRDAQLRDGTTVDAQATAACRISPEHAHLAAPHASDWPERARHCLDLCLRQTLGELALTDLRAGDIDLGDTGFGDVLAARLRGHLQHLVGGWGVSVAWVRPHSLRLPHAAREAAGEPPPTQRRPVMGLAASPDPQRIDLPERWPDSAGSPVADVASARGVTPGAMLPLPPAMRSATPVPAALAEAYDAVRERRVTDPSTIRRIAQAFETAARDPVMGPLLPFDAQTAACYLRQLADSPASSQSHHS